MILSKSIDLLLKGVRAEFADVVDQAQKQITAYNSQVYLDATNKTGPLFGEVNAVGRQRVEVMSVTGVNELAPTEEAQEFIEGDYVPSFVTTVEPYKFTRRIKVTREAAERRDTKYMNALNEASKLNIAAEMTKARHRFDRFNTSFAVVTSKHLFDYGDGVALCVANHPTKVVGAVQSNVSVASDISDTSIETMILSMQSWTDDLGEPMPMGGGIKYIVAPKEKVRKIKQNIESEWVTGSAQNNINVWYGQGWVVVVSPLLTSTTAWWILDGNFSPLKDVMFRNVTNETWFDENTKVFVHDISMEHKVGAYDFRGIQGNPGL